MPNHEQYSITKGDIIKAGNGRTVQFGQVEIAKYQPPTPCVIKTFDDPSELKREYSNYFLCKAAGLPVPAFCYQQNDALIFPNLTADNQTVVISSNSLSNCFSTPLNPVAASLDRESLFNQNPNTHVDINTVNFLDLQLKLKAVIAQAASNNIILHCDSYFFTLTPDGNNDIIIGDFGNISTPQTQPIPDLLEDQLTTEQWCSIRSSLYAEDLIAALAIFLNQPPPQDFFSN